MDENYEKIWLLNEALARLEEFKNSNTEASNYGEIETLINNFTSSINSEVR